MAVTGGPKSRAGRAGLLPGGKDFLVLELLYTGGCSDRHWDDNVVNIEGALSPSPPYWLL